MRYVVVCGAPNATREGAPPRSGKGGRVPITRPLSRIQAEHFASELNARLATDMYYVQLAPLDSHETV